MSKTKSSEYALVLLSGFVRSLANTERQLRDYFTSHKLEIPASLRSETMLLMFFAYDAGIASGTESLRENIRDHFADLVFSETMLLMFAASGKESRLRRENIREHFSDLVGSGEKSKERMDEYATAMRGNTGSSRYLQNIGHVFATHVGNGDANALVAAMAASAWANNYKAIDDLLKQQIGSIQYVPLPR
jgi:hypothetical protein